MVRPVHRGARHLAPEVTSMFSMLLNTHRSVLR